MALDVSPIPRVTDMLTDSTLRDDHQATAGQFGFVESPNAAPMVSISLLVIF